MSRHRSDVVGCAQPSERSARRSACPYRAVLASDATPRCASMASADRQMIGDATLASMGCFLQRLELGCFELFAPLDQTQAFAQHFACVLVTPG
ncbi:hypothetical protein Veis_2430 [Verminephrobacter eiseniae EF01-2]|uniref:Uncharacterized protein n=1 Tax=Verminephrobacter eiseniae (strain EF01-2) TaxID=391735 RepID=A1WKL9_VEREI|nr:hypothetical protein Veis_2430 [Verminephrobacter eiseniae EF01-2]